MSGLLQLNNKLILQVESWWDIRTEIVPIWNEHNAEIAAPADRPLLSPDWKKFDDMATKGQAHWVTARHFGKLVGYVFVIITTHLHRANVVCGFFDLYWVHPDHRKGMIGVRLFKFTEETLRLRRVAKTFIGTKVWYDIGKLLERLGYEQVETIYARAL